MPPPEGHNVPGVVFLTWTLPNAIAAVGLALTGSPWMAATLFVLGAAFWGASFFIRSRK